MNLNYKIHRLFVRLTHSVNEAPVFILGNQKTGSSAIASLLGEISNVGYVIDVFCHLEHQQKLLFDGEIDFNSFVKRSKDFFAKSIIKEPSFTFFYKSLYSRFPKAKFVLIIRDPFENVRSICNRLKIDGKSNDIHINLNDYPLDWKYITGGDFYGHSGQSIIHTLAKRCASCYNVFLENKNNIHLIKYEDFLRDKVGFISLLADYLDFPIKSNISNIVNRQYQPKGIASDPKSFFSQQNFDLISKSNKKLISDHYPS